MSEQSQAWSERSADGDDEMETEISTRLNSVVIGEEFNLLRSQNLRILLLIYEAKRARIHSRKVGMFRQ